MLIKLDILYHRLKLGIGILTVVIFSAQLLGCVPKNEVTEVPQNINYSPMEVALLLPLESQNKNTNTLANNLKNAAQLASQDLKHLNLILTVYPTSGEPTRAAIAAKEAIARGSQIIVGPLFSEETRAVTAALGKNKIKIISLSNDPSVAGHGVFIMGTTFQSIADRLVTFALSQGLQRIAVIGPKGTIGANGIQAAKSAIVSNDSILTKVSTYPLNVKGISDLAPKIYAELIASDTEAIIFTDSPTRGLGFITEQISSLFAKNTREMPQFMGLTRWDSAPNILDEPSLNQGWFVVPDQRFKTRYADRYKRTFGEATSEISWLAYDAIALIGGIIKKIESHKSAPSFEQKNFLGNNGFIGVNGIFRFYPTGVSERSLSIAEVVSGKFKLIDSAKKQFMKNYN